MESKKNEPSNLAKNLNSKTASPQQQNIFNDKYDVLLLLLLSGRKLQQLVQPSGGDIEPFDFSSPSPDDVVLQKQGQAFKKKKGVTQLFEARCLFLDEPVNTTGPGTNKPLQQSQGKPGQPGKPQPTTPPAKFQGIASGSLCGLIHRQIAFGRAAETPRG